MSDIQVSFGHKFSIGNHIRKSFSHRFRVSSSPGAGSGNARCVGATVTVHQGGSSRTIPVDSLNIARRKTGNSPSLTWSATIFDPDGTFNPDRAGTDWTGWLTPELQPVGPPTKTVTITIQAEAPGDSMSGTRTYTDLILLGRSYQADPAGGYTMTLTGADYSQVLFRDGQTMATVELGMSNDIIKGILSEYGFNGGDIVLDIPDFPVVQFDFQRDRPVNRIQTLLNESGAFWRVEGRRFFAWIPSLSAQPQWTYKDSNSIYTLSLTEQVITHHNMVTVSRVNKNGYIATEQSGASDGRFSARFSGKFWNPKLAVVENFGCVIEDVDYFQNGSHVGTTFHLGGSADEVYWTVTPVNPDIPSQWTIRVTGIPDLYMGSGVDLDSTYTYRDEASISAYGELPAPPIETNFVASNAMAQMVAEAFMREQGSLRRTVSFSAPINPWLEIDETIRVTEGVSTYSGIFNIESITTSIQGPDGADTLEVVEYER